MARSLAAGVALLLTWMLAELSGCGGGSPNALTSSSVTPTVNTAALVLDAGPAQVNAVNVAYTSVTLCVGPGSSQCQTIDHILVDTGSTGFRVLAEALGPGLTSAQLTQATVATGGALVECTQFADGYSWGPVKLATLQVAGEMATNLPIQVIGDPAYPSNQAPSACMSATNVEEDTVVQFGANGVLGIGNFLQDCGPYCATGTQDGSFYSSCSAAPPLRCQPATAALGQQVSNPVASFKTDNNGVLISFPPFPLAGSASGAGTLTFGIGTQSDNSLGAATVYTLDPDFGTLATGFSGQQFTQSFIDSGSNGYFFPDSSIAVCPDADFYCPATSLPLTAQLQGTNGAIASLGFTVFDADMIPAIDRVAPGLAGPAGSSALQSFDWGLPFFFGRNVYVVFEDSTIGGIDGLAVAF